MRLMAVELRPTRLNSFRFVAWFDYFTHAALTEVAYTLDAILVRDGGGGGDGAGE